MPPNDHQIEEFYTNSPGSKKEPVAPSPRSRDYWAWLKKRLPSKKQLRFLPQVLSKRERYLILTLALGILSLLIYWPIDFWYSITVAAPDFGGTYTEGLLGEPKYINPLLVQTNDTDRDLSRLLYSSLMKYDSAGNLVPDLAQSYEISSNGLEYLFVLKKDLRWHDGFPLTAEDVLFTIKILQNNDYGSVQRINWQGIETEKVDDYTVKLKLKNKYAQFLNNATLGILPKHLWENIKPTSFPLSDLNLKPIGSGPYLFKKLRKDSNGQIRSYELEAFEQYHAGRPFIQKLVYKFYPSEEELIGAYNQNEIEGLGFLSPQNFGQLKFSQKLSPQSIRLPRYFAAFFNQNRSEILADKNIRLALNYGTDKTTIVKQVLNDQGLAINSPLMTKADQNITQKYGYDPVFAKQILENSGWKDDHHDGYREKKDQPLTLKLKTSDWPDLVKTAEILKKQWEDLGIKTELQIETLADIQSSIKDRDYEVLVFGEVLTLDPDPYSFWHSSQKKDPGLNIALYDNQNADKILEESRQILNPLERAKKYENFETILLEDAPAVFLYSPYYLYLPGKRVKGNHLDILPLPSARFDTVNHWFTNTKRIRKTSS